MGAPRGSARGGAAPDLRRFIRDVPDFPEKGILFKDITPLLLDPRALDNLRRAIELHELDAASGTVVH